MKVKSGHYNGPETCRTAFVIPDHIAILLLLLLLLCIPNIMCDVAIVKMNHYYKKM